MKVLLVVGLIVCAAVAQADDLVVTILGSGGGPPTNTRRYGPSTLVQAAGETLLFDAGRGAAFRLAEAKIPFVSKIFLTHLHSDHIFSIPDLWLTPWPVRRDHPLEIWGPAGTAAMMANLEKAYEFDIHIRRDVDEKFPAIAVEVKATDVTEGVIYDNGGLKVTVFDVDHRPIKPAFGYRIDYDGHSVVISGDTRKSDNLIKFSEGVDVLIHEVYAADPKKAPNVAVATVVAAHHTTALEAGEVFAAVKPQLAVYSHIVPARLPEAALAALPSITAQTYEGTVIVGDDLMRIEIGDEVKVIAGR